MKTIFQISKEERKQVYNNAHNFLHDHYDYIHNLFDHKTPVVAPSGSDMFKPELWKDIHWAWFMTTHIFDNSSEEFEAAKLLKEF